MLAEDLTRDTHPDLARLVHRLWAPSHGSSSSRPVVLVTTGAVPDDYTVAEQYVVVPSLRRPRFLVPVDAPRAVRAAFTDHLSTVSARSRVTGRAVAAAFRGRLGPLAFGGRLTVAVDRTVPRGEWARHLLLTELAQRLGVEDLVGIHPVRRQTPNAKPTIRLFDRSGVARGYVKVGWSSPTRSLVRVEVDALRELDGSVGRLAVPRVLVEGSWTASHGPDLQYLVTTALPAGLGRWRGTPATDRDVLLAVAGTGCPWKGPLAGSAYARTLRDRLASSAAAQPDEVAALGAWLDRLLTATVPLAFGRWHGDWVPWNLATTPRGGAVWDWEYSAAQAPVGFDVCHWYFQGQLAGHADTLDTAAAELAGRRGQLSVVGVTGEAQELVAQLYLLEMLTRATTLAAEGAGWNSKLHPRLTAFAEEASLPSPA